MRVRFVFRAPAIHLAPPAPIVFFWILNHDMHETQTGYSTSYSLTYVLCVKYESTGGDSLQGHQFAVTLQHLCKGMCPLLLDGVILEADGQFGNLSITLAFCRVIMHMHLNL